MNATPPPLERLTDAVVDRAIAAWNATPVGAHGHLIENKFERKQMRAALETLFAPAPERNVHYQDRIYPCQQCGIMRSRAEGGTIFTVCDTCWDKLKVAP